MLKTYNYLPLSVMGAIIAHRFKQNNYGRFSPKKFLLFLWLKIYRGIGFIENSQLFGEQYREFISHSQTNLGQIILKHPEQFLSILNNNDIL